MNWIYLVDGKDAISQGIRNSSGWTMKVVVGWIEYGIDEG